MDREITNAERDMKELGIPDVTTMPSGFNACHYLRDLVQAYESVWKQELLTKLRVEAHFSRMSAATKEWQEVSEEEHRWVVRRVCE